MNDQPTRHTARAAMQDMVFGYRLSQLIFVAAQLNIADRLKDGAKDHHELAEACGINADALYRCLRALASAGVFNRVDGDRFELNELSRLLQSDITNSLRPFAIYNAQTAYPKWQDALSAIRTGENVFQLNYGKSIWEYLDEHPSDRQAFDAAMSGIIAFTAAAVVEAYDFSRFTRIVDVGGGQGVLLARILAANPTAHGVLFDQAQVVRGANPILQAAGVSERCQIASGSFFDTVPAEGDAYTLSHIIHDWDDAPSRQILTTCRRAMKPGTTLLLIERVLDPKAPRLQDTLSDMHMLVSLSGCERTREEYATLLTAAGFEINRVIPTKSPDGIIEATAV